VRRYYIHPWWFTPLYTKPPLCKGAIVSLASLANGWVALSGDEPALSLVLTESSKMVPRRVSSSEWAVGLNTRSSASAGMGNEGRLRS